MPSFQNIIHAEIVCVSKKLFFGCKHCGKDKRCIVGVDHECIFGQDTLWQYYKNFTVRFKSICVACHKFTYET